MLRKLKIKEAYHTALKNQKHVRLQRWKWKENCTSKNIDNTIPGITGKTPQCEMWRWFSQIWMENFRGAHQNLKLGWFVKECSFDYYIMGLLWQIYLKFWSTKFTIDVIQLLNMKQQNIQIISYFDQRTRISLLFSCTKFVKATIQIYSLAAKDILHRPAIVWGKMSTMVDTLSLEILFVAEVLWINDQICANGSKTIMSKNIVYKMLKMHTITCQNVTQCRPPNPPEAHLWISRNWRESLEAWVRGTEGNHSSGPIGASNKPGWKYAWTFLLHSRTAKTDRFGMVPIDST